MKIILIDDLNRYVEHFAQTKVRGHELYGIYVSRNYMAVFDCAGERKDLIAEEVVAGAGIIFLDHNMPDTGDVVLKCFKERGLITDKTRVIGTSSKDQNYVNEQVSSGDAVDSDFILKIASEMKQ